MICTEEDFDLDGDNEIIYSDKNFFSVVRPDTASFIELDDREQKINILNYLGRRKESYHDKIPKKSNDGDVKSIHEVFRSKQNGLSELLIYDNYPRGFGIDHDLEKIPAVHDFYCNTMPTHIIHYLEHKIVQTGPVKLEFNGDLNKTIKFESRTISIKYSKNTDRDRLIGVEFSLGIFQPDLRLSGNNIHAPAMIENIRDLKITASGLRPISFETSTLFHLFTYPIETISSSESGYEKIFQGICILMVFKELPEIKISL
jgi:alpha-amylase